MIFIFRDASSYKKQWAHLWQELGSQASEAQNAQISLGGGLKVATKWCYFKALQQYLWDKKGNLFNFISLCKHQATIIRAIIQDSKKIREKFQCLEHIHCLINRCSYVKYFNNRPRAWSVWPLECKKRI